MRDRSDQHESLEWTHDVATRSLRTLPDSTDHSWTGVLEGKADRPVVKDSREITRVDEDWTEEAETQKNWLRRS